MVLIMPQTFTTLIMRKVQMRLPRPQGGWASVKRSEAWARTRRSWQRRLQLSVLAQYPSTVR